MKPFGVMAATATILVALAACQKPAPAADPSAAAASASPETVLPSVADTASSEWTGAPAPPLPKDITRIPATFQGRWGQGTEGCGDAMEIDASALAYGEDDDTVRQTTILSSTHIRVQVDHYGEATSDLPAGASTYGGTSTYDLTLQNGGKTLRRGLKDGTVITYTRCVAAAEADDASQ